MSTFSGPVIFGDSDPGTTGSAAATDYNWTRGYGTFTKQITVSAGLKKNRCTFPDNCQIVSMVFNVTTTFGAALTQGATVRVGDGSVDTQYATQTNVSAVGIYSPTMKTTISSAKTIYCDVTASVAASAADTTGFKGYLLVTGSFQG